MPVLADGELTPYARRFEYLLMNVPEIFQAGKIKVRDSINSLYPDTVEIRRTYLEAFCSDEKLVNYFEESAAAVTNPDFQREKKYTVDELMEVASKFFYCDEVFPDTTVQMHICIGFNGVSEAKWEEDYTLLAAFCFEAIFDDMYSDSSQIRPTYSSVKEESCEQFRSSITTLDKYLLDVRTDVFSRMKSNATLKERLLAYYELNKSNLAFEIVQ